MGFYIQERAVKQSFPGQFHTGKINLSSVEKEKSNLHSVAFHRWIEKQLNYCFSDVYKGFSCFEQTNQN